MIPKRIHYCWFGGKPFPKPVKRYMESWKRVCPDFKLIRWDESNSPLEDNLYVKQAFQAKKWAFVSDYVRLYALVQYGGIYLDTDVELLQSLEPYLNQAGFLGFESAGKVATCVMGAAPRHPLFEGLAEAYNGRVFLGSEGRFDETTNVLYVTRMLSECGLRPDGTGQTIGGISVYPPEYFSPKSLETGKITVTENTAAIHHFQASWMSPRQRFHTTLAQSLGPRITGNLKIFLGRSV